MKAGLFLGLGNPGEAYARTRHNIGFMVLDKIAQDYKLIFTEKKGLYWFTEFSYSDTRIVLVKPKTYMNLSGLAAQEAVAHFGIEISQTLIIYDDINLPFGKLRIRAKGSDGGHKGISSIIYHLQTIDIPRLRFGIGHNFDNEQKVDYVLSPFDEEEAERLPGMIELAVNASLSFATNGIIYSMDHYNSNRNSSTS